MRQSTESLLHHRLVGQLYVEAMVLADEARTYFDEAGRAERDPLDPFSRVMFSCESLKVTTRLMHVIAWLLTQRAVAAGELRTDDAWLPDRRLGMAPESDPAVIATMPDTGRQLIVASIDLHRRAAVLDRIAPAGLPSPVQSLQARLAGAFQAVPGLRFG